MAVAEASLSTLKLSMLSAESPGIAAAISILASSETRSSGLRSIEPSNTTPFSTHKGFVLPDIDVAPRVLVFMGACAVVV